MRAARRRGAELLRPVERAGARGGGGDADRAEARVLDVGAVAGRVQPALHDRARGRVAVGDVLAPARGRRRVPAGQQAVADAARDRRRRVGVLHVPVARHVPRLPDRRVRERRRHRQLGQPERGAVLVHELDDLRREVLAERAPVGTRRAVADGGAGDGGCPGHAGRCGHATAATTATRASARLNCVFMFMFPLVDPVRAAGRVQKTGTVADHRAGGAIAGTGDAGQSTCRGRSRAEREQCRDELGGRVELVDVADRAGVACLLHPLRIGAREHQHAHPRPSLAHEPRRDDPVDARHVDVHQHDVRVLPAGELHCLLAVLRDPDHLELAAGRAAAPRSARRSVRRRRR